MAVQSLQTSGTSLQSLFQQRRTDFKALGRAVQSGDISSAQTALAAFQSNTQSIQSQTGQITPISGYSQNTKLQGDINNLFSAVQSGNITDAQSALTTFQTDTSDSSSQVGAAGQTGTTQSSFGQDFAQLIEDLQNGNTSALQTDTNNLSADFQSLTGQGSATQAASSTPDTPQSPDATDPSGQVGASSGHHHHHGGHHNVSSASQSTSTDGTDDTTSPFDTLPPVTGLPNTNTTAFTTSFIEQITFSNTLINSAGQQTAGQQQAA